MSDRGPAISIIIPVYNVERYLRRCLDSVLAQTFSQWECVVVDDGSPDGCPAICDEYAARDGRFRALHQANAGVSAARNAGLDAARGAWIGFVDSDDWCEREMFQVLYETATQNDADVSICGVKFALSGETSKETQTISNSVMILNSKEAIVKMLSPDDYRGFSFNKLIRHDIIKKYHIRYNPAIKFMEDNLFFYNVFKKTRKVIYSPHALLYNYNQHHNSISQNGGVTEAKLTALIACDIMYESETDTQLKKEIMVSKLVFAYNSCRRCIIANRIDVNYWSMANIIKNKHRYIITDNSISIKKKIKYFLLLFPTVLKFYSDMILLIKRFLSAYTETEWNIGFVNRGVEDLMVSQNLSVIWMKHDYRNRWFADPFILDMDDKNIVILAEDYDRVIKRGCISRLIVDRESLSVKAREVVTGLPASHLSFPAVYRKNGTIYLYPENSALGNLTLYKYIQDENRAEPVAVLCQEPLTDAVLTDVFQIPYCFSTKLPVQNGNILYIYRADTWNGTYTRWQTVLFKDNTARSAGNLFQIADKIIRPAQDCNDWYGKGLVLQEVMCNDNIFHFQEIKRIYSNSKKWNIGIHTVNACNGMIVVDGKRYRHAVLGRFISYLLRMRKRFLNVNG